MKNRTIVSVAWMLLLAGTGLSAEVRLPKILSSHMVLQRDQPIHLWGWADPGESIAVTLGDSSRTVVADDLGKWSAFLPPRAAGGPFTISVTGSNRLVMDDVMIGDVWFASGQSNMEMPLEGFIGSAVVKNGDEEIRNANHPDLRLLFVPHKASPFPLKDFDSDQSWTACTPETARKFSAVAYFFGREISSREHVTVGLIDSTWGGTPAEAWISMNTLSSDAALMPVFAAWTAMGDEQAEVPLHRAVDKREDEAAKRAGKPAPNHPWHPDFASWDPSWLYNGMVAPAVDFPIKGAIWYQGESNSGAERGNMYEKVFPALIADWRRHWREGAFPFYFVQISSFGSNTGETWPVVREAQRRALGVVNTGMAVTIDVGDPGNVHPSDKQTVGSRLALAARALTYGEKLEYSGPMFRATSMDEGALRVWFDHARGLTAHGSELLGFEIAGADRRFAPATARVERDTVVVTGSGVTKPVYVRYGWKNVTDANLYNSDGLPASPFTSEEVIPEPKPGR